MAIYINNTQITSAYIGGISNPPMYINSTQVFPDGGTYTFALTNLGINYSSGGYLLANQSNYAWITGTYITYCDGAQKSSESVICSPLSISSISDWVTYDSSTQYFKWNKDKYGRTAKYASQAISISGATYNGLKVASGISLMIGGNSETLSSATVTAWTVGGYSSPHTFASGDTVYPMTISGKRQYVWSSGLSGKTVYTSAYSLYMDLTGELIDYQDGQGAYEAYFDITNNSEQTINITVYVEDEFTFYDEDGTKQVWYDTGSEQCIIGNGETYRTNSIYASAEEGTSYTGSHQHRCYFKIDGYDTEYIFLDKGSSKRYIDTIYSNNYFTVTSNNSYAIISNMTLELKTNTTSSTKYHYLTARDKLFTATTKTYVAMQSS